MSNCKVCNGSGWVCEDHKDTEWDDAHQDQCGAGQPCKCNVSNPPWDHKDDRDKEDR